MNERIYQQVELTRVGEGSRTVQERIIRETELILYVNGELYATALVLAGREKEYAAGLIYSSGSITHASDIASITIKGNVVDVKLTRVLEQRTPGSVNSNLIIRRADIFACVRAILKSPVFEETEAVHSAGLFKNGKDGIAITEDIGRQHAFDKVIGQALLAGADFGSLLAASTGRIPLEMIIKCSNTGIPIITTKGVPTSAAVELAEINNITIAGLVRGRNMVVYCHPERIS